jgi:ABC-type uncharacterized transport system ATPase subunit
VARLQQLVHDERRIYEHIRMARVAVRVDRMKSLHGNRRTILELRHALRAAKRALRLAEEMRSRAIRGFLFALAVVFVTSWSLGFNVSTRELLAFGIPFVLLVRG